VRGGNPWTHLPRRIVADVLAVSTLQVGHPMLLGVLMKADDSTRNRRTVGKSQEQSRFVQVTAVGRSRKYKRKISLVKRCRDGAC
jgi:hypothetical protein